jgi:hypothetical protein
MIDACRQRLAQIVGAESRGEQQEVDVVRAVVVAEPSGQLGAREAGHLGVGDDEVGATLGDEVPRAQAIFGRVDLEAGGNQRRLDLATDPWIVVGDDNETML